MEELLNELPKRECFEDFCEALIADGQEHIVKKYLKVPLPAAVKSQPFESAKAPPPQVEAAPASSNCATPTFISAEGASAESTDSSTSFSQAPAKRSHAATSSSTAVICIREEDNRHLYITYTDEGASPEKRKRALEVGTATDAPVIFEPDETRYTMKHFVSQESGQQEDTSLIPLMGGNQIAPHMVLNNPQSVTNNPNISDPLRYSAAFPSNQLWKTSTASVHPSHTNAQAGLTHSAALSSPPEPAGTANIHSSSSSNIHIAAMAAPPSTLSSPLKDPSSLVNKQEAQNAHIRNLLRPQQGQSFMNISQLKAAKSGNFIR